MTFDFTRKSLLTVTNNGIFDLCKATDKALNGHFLSGRSQDIPYTSGEITNSLISKLWFYFTNLHLSSSYRRHIFQYWKKYLKVRGIIRSLMPCLLRCRIPQNKAKFTNIQMHSLIRSNTQKLNRKISWNETIHILTWLYSGNSWILQFAEQQDQRGSHLLSMKLDTTYNNCLNRTNCEDFF